jgi:hypothetical protein
MTIATGRLVLKKEAQEPRVVKFLRRILGTPSNTEMATATVKTGRTITGEALISPDGKLVVHFGSAQGEDQIPIKDIDFVSFVPEPGSESRVHLIAFIKDASGARKSRATYVGTVDINEENFIQIDSLIRNFGIGVSKAYRTREPTPTSSAV